jgi:hypothetical protein
MPTTLTSSGITFNDATSQTTSALAAGAIGTAQIAANSVTAAKLGTTERLQIAKAWVNFNGTGTPAIRSSYNVSSISKNGTGDYTVNLVAGAVADASYSIALSRSYQNGSTGGTIGESTSATRTATTVRVYTFTVGGSAQDDPLISLQIFGN